MPKNTIRFDEDKGYAYGRALKAFAAAAVLAVAGWQFAKWYQHPIDHEGVKLANNHVTIGGIKMSDPFAVMFNRMGVREGEGATRGTQTFAEVPEKTTKPAEQVDPRTQRREEEARDILESYKQFLLTHPQPHEKYKFLKDSMMLTLGTIHYENEQLNPEIDSLFKLFRQTARDAFADLRLQALREPDFDYHDRLMGAAIDSYNTASDPDAEKYWGMRVDAEREISERRKQFQPAP